MLARFPLPAFGLALAVLPAACAPPSAGMAGPAPSASLSGPANAGGAPMAGMDHSAMMNMKGMEHSGMNMPGMDMTKMDMKNLDMGTMMSHCAQMRQQAGAGQTAQGKQMLDQCDQMDRSMGMTPPARR